MHHFLLATEFMIANDDTDDIDAQIAIATKQRRQGVGKDGNSHQEKRVEARSGETDSIEHMNSKLRNEAA